VRTDIRVECPSGAVWIETRSIHAEFLRIGRGRLGGPVPLEDMIARITGQHFMNTRRTSTIARQVLTSRRTARSPRDTFVRNPLPTLLTGPLTIGKHRELLSEQSLKRTRFFRFDSLWQRGWERFLWVNELWQRFGNWKPDSPFQ